jgi:putative ABC transport system permease protein
MYVCDTIDPVMGSRVPIHATTEDYTTISDDWFYVTPESLEAFRADKHGALFARQTAKDLMVHVGQQVTLPTEKGDLKVTVSGISPKGFKSSGILVHHEYATAVWNVKDQANFFWVELSTDVDGRAAQHQAEELFQNTPTPAKAGSTTASLQAAAATLSIVPRLVSVAGLVILFATLLVTANTVAISVRERIPEFASLRAIGFRRGRILALILFEVELVCLAAGVIGCLIPVLILQGVVSLGAGPYGNVEVGFGILLWGALISAVLGLIAGWVPAWNASRISVVDALRAA